MGVFSPTRAGGGGGDDEAIAPPCFVGQVAQEPVALVRMVAASAYSELAVSSLGQRKTAKTSGAGEKALWWRHR